jgi:hypothetical protein
MPHQNRTFLLAALGAATAILFAGCNGGDATGVGGSGDDQPPPLAIPINDGSNWICFRFYRVKGNASTGGEDTTFVELTMADYDGVSRGSYVPDEQTLYIEDGGAFYSDGASFISLDIRWDGTAYWIDDEKAKVVKSCPPG